MNDHTKQLIEKAKQGDNIAISELMNQYNSELFNLAKMYSSSDSDAEDALQNTYIRAFRNLSSLEDINKFDSWIKQITIEEAQSLKKQTARETTKPLQRRFDPITGKPIGSSLQQSFDSLTGSPIGESASVQPSVTGSVVSNTTTIVTSTGAATTIGTKPRRLGATALKILLGCAVITASVLGGKYLYEKVLVSSKTNNEASAYSDNTETGTETDAKTELLNNTKYVNTKTTYYNKEGSINSWWEYEYDTNGNKIKYTYYHKDGKINNWCEYEYDTNGNEIKSTNYSEDGSFNSWNEYEYDASGNKTNQTYYYNGSISSWYEYEYDTNGNQIKETGYDKDGSISYLSETEYDANGNQIKGTWYDNDASTDDFWYECEYDINGNEIKRTIYDFDGSISSWIESEYDTSGNCIKSTDYNEDGSISLWCEYEYDANGKQIKSTIYNSYGSIISCRGSEYDTNGNEIKETNYSNDGSINVWWELEWIQLGEYLKGKGK